MKVKRLKKKVLIKCHSFCFTYYQGFFLNNLAMFLLLFQVHNLTALIKELESKHLLQGEDSEILTSIDIKLQDLVGRQLSKIKKKPLKKKYSPGLRSFALTLYYYSPKAYAYVRKTFDTCLPHPRTISKWYETVDGDAGFTAEAFKILKHKNNTSGKPALCSLIMDEIAIRKHVEWDGNKYHGYVDLGLNDVQTDNSEQASQALVLLLVSQTERWKLPVGFFLIHSMTGEQRALIIQQCLYKCQENGVDVVSLTIDGCAANIAMVKKLGCSLEPQAMKTTFRHPSAHYQVAVFLDACHMLKLVRNAFENKKRFLDYQGNYIEWFYLVNLNNLQKSEGLHLGNKLKDQHINFQRQKMKVNLASQLFSNSVADALHLCEKSDVRFKNAGATISFIRLINNVFDILNSRNMCQVEYKKPLFENNITKTKEYLEFAKYYLMYIVTPDEDKPVIVTNRKTGFVGLLTCINSALFLYDRLIEKEKVLKYLTLYRFTQVHLELFFGVIRAHGRANNNPTSRQFKAAYKKTLINTELKESFGGNCIPLEDISILNESSVQKINITSERYRILQNDLSLESSEGTDVEPMADELLLEFDEQLNTTIGDYLRRQIVAYISGYVVKDLHSKIKCESCLKELYADNYDDDDLYLIKIKNKGGLTFPSKDVINICLRTECSIRSVQAQSLNTLNFRKHKIVSNTLKSLIGQDCFKKSANHMFDQSPTVNHVILLIKCIAEKYIDIRFKHFESIQNDTVNHRQQITISVIFSGN